MKSINLIFVFTFIFNVVLISQNYDGYKYIIVPDLIYEKGTDIYGVSSYTRQLVKDKGLIIAPTDPPDDLINNQCLALQCQIKTSFGSIGDINGNIITTGVVEIVIRNCENEIVYNGIGSTQAGSPWHIVFQKSTDKALKKFKYKYNPNSFKHKAIPLFPSVEKINETEETLKDYYVSNNIKQLEGIYKSYQSETLGYYKFGIKKINSSFKAIIIESDNNIWKPGEVKAEFELSSVQGFYSTKYYMKNKSLYETFATIEDESILIIKLKDQKTGQKSQSKFVKIFPQPVDSEKNNDNQISVSGSGFILNKNGIIATNSHVINNAKKIEIVLPNDFQTITYTADILLNDKNNDVALLKINSKEFIEFKELPYQILEICEIGEKVFTIGYPLNDIMGSNYKVTDGIVSSQSGISDDIRYMQITVPLQPGNSGGPLFNKDGNIVGITSAKLNESAVGTTIENVNYAIKMSYLLNLYKMLPSGNEISPNSKLENLELKDQVKILKDYVCLIKVYF